MKKVATVGDFYVYKFEPDEVVVKGCKYGIVYIDSAERTEYLIPCDMDFFEKTKSDAINRALSWS